MSSGGAQEGLSVDEAVRTLLLLMPRVIGRAKRSRTPARLEEYHLAPRHLSLLAYLFYDGPLSVNELAARLEVVPATVSLLVSELNRSGVVDRKEDDTDRRRKIVSIAQEHTEAVRCWLENGIHAWRTALEPLSGAERQTFVDTLRSYESELMAVQERAETGPRSATG